MYDEGFAYKLWRIISPLIFYIIVNITVQTIFTTLLICVQSTIITSISALITLFLFYRLFPQELSFGKISISIKYIYIALLAIFSNVSLSRLLWLLPIDNIIGSYEKVEQTIITTNPVIDIISVAFLIPIIEEVIFRGLVYKRLKQITHKYTATLVVSLMFGVYHMNLVQGIYAFLLGLILIFVYEKYNSIIAPIIMHIVANATSLFLAYTNINDIINRNFNAYIIIMMLEFIATGIIIRRICKKIN